MLSLQISSYSMLLIAGWFFACGIIPTQSGLFIMVSVLAVIGLLIRFLALHGSPLTVSQVCFLVYSF